MHVDFIYHLVSSCLSQQIDKKIKQKTFLESVLKNLQFYINIYGQQALWSSSMQLTLLKWKPSIVEAQVLNPVGIRWVSLRPVP